MKIRYSRRALVQLDAVYAYIEERNPAAALKVKTRIRFSIDRLARFPYSARATDRKGVRVLTIVRYPYLVFYSVDDQAQTVDILRIRHTARDPARHLD